MNRGCVPKKLLWDAAWHRVQHSALGFDAPSLTLSQMQDDIAGKISTIRDSFLKDLEKAGVQLVRGAASIAPTGHAVDVDGETYTAESLVIATGARPSTLDIDGGNYAETSNDVLSWQDVPESIIFLGGGYIGCELASIFASFGADVTIVDPGDRLLTQFDADMISKVTGIFEARGIKVLLGAEPKSIARADAKMLLELHNGSRLQATCVVAAIGRTPNIDGLGEKAKSLTVAKSGALKIDDRFQTSAQGIYAIGDASDRLPLTPVATRDGEILAEMLFGDTSVHAIDLSYVASAAFVMPPIAQVGEPGDGTVNIGHDLTSGAIVPEGHWVTTTMHKRAMADGKTNGVAIMASAAADMIAPFAALVVGDAHNPAKAATGVHPTFGEETVGR